MTDPILAHEITLCALNDADLYRSRIVPIIANLRRKQKRGIYDAKLALVLWGYAAEDAVLRYSVEHMGQRKATLTILDKADRLTIAEAFADHFAEELAPPPAMTEARVIETGRQFGQKISKREANTIARLLKGRH